MKIMLAFVVAQLFTTIQVFGGEDHVEYYHGTVHYTTLVASKPAPPDTELDLKREVLPSRNQIIETATMRWNGRIQDLQTVENVQTSDSGYTVWINGYGGAMVGSGYLEGAPWAWNYTNLSITIVRTGEVTRDINVLSQNRLSAWKETRDKSGNLEQLWESDLDLITASDYQNIYARLHGQI